MEEHRDPETIDIQLHLLSTGEEEGLDSVFVRRWPSRPLRGITVDSVPGLIFAGVASAAMLMAKLRELTCEYKYKGLVLYTGGKDDPVVIKVKDLSDGAFDELPINPGTDLPGGTLMIVKPDGNIEMHNLCKGSVDLNAFLKFFAK